MLCGRSQRLSAEDTGVGVGLCAGVVAGSTLCGDPGAKEQASRAGGRSALMSTDGLLLEGGEKKRVRMGLTSALLLQSHSCVEKAAMIGFVKLRILDTDEKFQLRGGTLARAIEVYKL